MAKPSLVQLHTTIDSNLMSKFKRLCQSPKYPISVGTAVKRLIKESVKNQQLPGEQINSNKVLQKLIYNYLLDSVNISGLSVHLNSAIMHHCGIKAQERTIKDVALVAKEVIPEPQGIPMYEVAMTRDFLQILLLDYMISEHILAQYIHVPSQHSYKLAFLSKLSILSDLLSPVFTGTIYGKKTWFDASGTLVKKLPVLGNRWRDLMYNITSASWNLNDWIIVLKWHLHQYINKHVKNSIKFDENKAIFKLTPDANSNVVNIIRQLREVAHKVTIP